MATIPYICRLIRDANPGRFDDHSDREILDFINDWQANRGHFDPDELERFASAAETLDDFLHYVVTTIPRNA